MDVGAFTSTLESNGPVVKTLANSVMESLDPFIFQFPPTQNFLPIFVNVFFAASNDYKCKDFSILMISLVLCV
jgi:hypothetical protein